MPTADRLISQDCVLLLSCALFAASLPAADTSFYLKKSTWQDTMLASREALMQTELSEARGALKSGKMELGPWHVIGPFVAPKGKKVFPHVFPPETKIDLAAAYVGGKLRWRKQEQWADGTVYRLKAPSRACTYLYRTIDGKGKGRTQGFFGSDDGLTVWLNGKLILERDVPRGPAPNQDRAKLKLKPGVNHLLLKISNRTGGHGFYFSTSAKPSEKSSAQAN